MICGESCCKSFINMKKWFHFLFVGHLRSNLTKHFSGRTRRHHPRFPKARTYTRWSLFCVENVHGGEFERFRLSLHRVRVITSAVRIHVPPPSLSLSFPLYLSLVCRDVLRSPSSSSYSSRTRRWSSPGNAYSFGRKGYRMVEYERV